MLMKLYRKLSHSLLLACVEGGLLLQDDRSKHYRDGEGRDADRACCCLLRSLKSRTII